MFNPVQQFLVDEGQIKVAGFIGDILKDPATPIVATVAAPLTLMAAQEGYQEIKGMINKSRGFKAMMKYNPKLKKLPATKVKALYGTLHNVAPDLAKDPVVASSWVTRTAYADEYIDPRTIADLGAAQQRMGGGRSLELPIAAMSSGFAASIGDYQRQAETAKRFEHQKAQDAITAAKNQATMEKDRTQKAMFEQSMAMASGKDRRDKIRLGLERARAKNERALMPARLREGEERANLAFRKGIAAKQALTQQEQRHGEQLEVLRQQARAERARRRMYEGP